MRFSLLILLVCACAHLPKPLPNQTLFPTGTYKHTIDVHMTQKGWFPARGILQLTHKGIKLFLLGPNDITVAKISETFETQQIILEIYVDDLKKHKASMERLYPLLRNFILFPPNKDNWGGLTQYTSKDETHPRTLKGPQNIEFVITEFNNNHPTKFKINHPQFSVSIEEFN